MTPSFRNCISAESSPSVNACGWTRKTLAERSPVMFNSSLRRAIVVDVSGMGGSTTLIADAGIESPSLRVVAGTVQRSLPAQPGQAYACRALYRLTAGGTGSLRVEYLNAGGTLIGLAQASLSQSAAWRTAEVLFTAPAGTASLRLVAAAAGAAELSVDDLIADIDQAL